MYRLAPPPQQKPMIPKLVQPCVTSMCCLTDSSCARTVESSLEWIQAINFVPSDGGKSDIGHAPPGPNKSGTATMNPASANLSATWKTCGQFGSFRNDHTTHHEPRKMQFRAKQRAGRACLNSTPKMSVMNSIARLPLPATYISIPATSTCFPTFSYSSVTGLPASRHSGVHILPGLACAYTVAPRKEENAVTSVARGALFST